MLDAFVLILTAVGAIGTLVSAFTDFATLRRTPKLPEPPITPSCVIVTSVEMQRPEGLLGHSRLPRDRLL